MIRCIKKYFSHQVFSTGSIAAVLTGPFEGAFGHVWERHEESAEVTIRPHLGMGRFQDIIVKEEIVVLGGGVTDPMEFCMWEDGEDEDALDPWMDDCKDVAEHDNNMADNK